MSLISITFDSKTKVLTCTMDGVELPSVCGINFYKYMDYKDHESVDMRIEMSTEDEDNGVCYHNMMTANTLPVKQGIAKEIPNSDGIYAYSSSKAKIEEDVSKMLGRS